MAIREIVKRGDPVLGKPCRVVETIDERICQLLDDMVETMHTAKGVGLAAPQVGILKRIAVIDVGDGPIELINPKIIAQSGRQNGPEGCLSVPGVFGEVERPMHVTVQAQNRKGETVQMVGDGLLARAFCHEIEHLDGKLFLPRVTRFIDPEEE